MKPPNVKQKAEAIDIDLELEDGEKIYCSLFISYDVGLAFDIVYVRRSMFEGIVHKDVGLRPFSFLRCGTKRDALMQVS